MIVHITSATEDRLQTLAATTARTPDDLAEEGLSRFLAYRESLESQVKAGREAAARGDLVDHDVVMRMMEDIIEHG